MEAGKGAMEVGKMQVKAPGPQGIGCTVELVPCFVGVGGLYPTALVLEWFCFFEIVAKPWDRQSRMSWDTHFWWFARVRGGFKGWG